MSGVIYYRPDRVLLLALMAFPCLTLQSSVSLAQEPSVPGVYLLVEVDGEKLPATTRRRSSATERCETSILDGAVLFDSEGRSAAFVTEQEICIGEDGSETFSRLESVIFPGSYRVSGNEITISDNLGTDHAIRDGDLLIYISDPDSAEYVLRKR